MKIAFIIIRILLGLMFLMASVTYFLKLYPVPEMHGNVKTFNEGIQASGYLMNLVKVTELVCSIAFISGFFVPLAAVVIFPVTLNILCYHISLAPENLNIAIPLILANLFLAWYCRKNYTGLLQIKPIV